MYILKKERARKNNILQNESKGKGTPPGTLARSERFQPCQYRCVETNLRRRTFSGLKWFISAANEIISKLSITNT